MDLCSDVPCLTRRQERADGSLLISSIEARLGWWEKTASSKFPWLAKVAQVLLPRHVTTCAAERNWSVWGNVYTKARNRLAVGRAEKLIFIAGNKGCRNVSEEQEVTMLLLEEADD